jgi:hypothetical protein
MKVQRLKYIPILLVLIASSACKKGESFDGYFGIQSTVVYSTSCSTRYFASYRDNSGYMNQRDFITGSQSWTVKMNSGKIAEIEYQTFGEPGTISISVNGVTVVSKNTQSKANVDLSYSIP